MQIVRENPKKEIPGVLSDLRDIIPIDFNELRGVYFLFLNEEIVYIGQSQNVYVRIQNHINEKVKVFNRAFVQFIPLEFDLQEVEKHYILKYRPKYNYETTAKSCERPITAEYISYELERIVKPNRIDQVYLKEAIK